MSEKDLAQLKKEAVEKAKAAAKRKMEEKLAAGSKDTQQVEDPTLAKAKAAAAAKAKAAALAKQKAVEKQASGSEASETTESVETSGADAKAKAAAAAKAKAAAAAKAKVASQSKQQQLAEGADNDTAAGADEKAKAIAAAKAKAAAAAKAKAAAAAKETGAVTGGEDEKAKAIAAAKAKAAALAKAKSAGATQAADNEGTKEETPSPNQPFLDKYIKVIEDHLGSDVLEDAYINKLSKDVPTLVAKPDSYYKIAEFLKYNEQLGFDYLSEHHGSDFETHMEVYNHLYSYKNRQSVALKVKINRAKPEIDSLSLLWEGANWPERESFDLLGIKYINHPNLQRIMLADDWVGHPLRKDYEQYDVEV